MALPAWIKVADWPSSLWGQFGLASILFAYALSGSHSVPGFVMSPLELLYQLLQLLMTTIATLAIHFLLLVVHLLAIYLPAVHLATLDLAAVHLLAIYLPVVYLAIQN